MKSIHHSQDTLQNAFLKVQVAGSIQRVYFRDVKHYKKYVKRSAPHVPTYPSCYPAEQVPKDSPDEHCRIA